MAGRCVPFDHFFEVTPHDLLVGGLFRELAMPLNPHGRYHAASLAMIHQKFGAELGRARAVAQIRRSLTTTKQLVLERVKRQTHRRRAFEAGAASKTVAVVSSQASPPKELDEQEAAEDARV